MTSRAGCWAILGLLPWLISCNTESERNLHLRARVNQEQKQVAAVQEEMNVLYNDLREIWQRSLKYRFPYLQRVSQAELEINQPGLEFLKTVRFTNLSEKQATVSIGFMTDQAKVQPQLTLDLFDDDGIHLQRETIIYKSGVFSRSLPVGQRVTLERKLTLVVPIIPVYFSLQAVKE